LNNPFQSFLNLYIISVSNLLIIANYEISSATFQSKRKNKAIINFIEFWFSLYIFFRQNFKMKKIEFKRFYYFVILLKL